MNVHPAKGKNGRQVIGPNGKPGWRLAFTAGKDPATGRHRQVEERFYGTRKQAEEAWYRRQAEIDAQGAGFVKPAKETVAEYVEAWLRTYGESNLKPTTLESYRRMSRLFIVPTLGALPLADLTARHVDEALARMIRPEDDGGFGVSHRTAGYCHSILRAALNEAVRKGDLARNPVALARPPRGESQKVRGYTLADMERLTEAARGHRLEALFALAWQTGLRAGEL